MINAINALRWILRIAFLLSITLGVILWSGHGYQYLSLHMWVGFVITFDLLLLVITGLVARIRPVLPLLALVFAAALPILGIGQLRVLPGPNHWTIRVVHLLIGVFAIGLGEALAKRALVALQAARRTGAGISRPV